MSDQEKPIKRVVEFASGLWERFLATRYNFKFKLVLLLLSVGLCFPAYLADGFWQFASAFVIVTGFVVAIAFDDDKNRKWTLVVESVLAVIVTAVVIVLIKGDDQLSGAGLIESAATGTLFALLLISANLVMSASKEAISASENVSQLKEVTHSVKAAADLISGHAAVLDHVKLAAEAISVRTHTVKDGKEPFVAAARAAFATTGSWLSSGAGALQRARTAGVEKMKAPEETNLTGDVADALERAWWGAMRVYAFEERYDLTRFELATNVRNYAFLLLDAIESYRQIHDRSKAVDLADAPDRAPALEKRIVIVQCSPFPPKDFINFPHGIRSKRRYWDSEFFGSYRRSLTFITALDEIESYRLTLTRLHNQDDDNQNESHFTKLQEQGFSLDTDFEVAAKCCSMIALPFAVSIEENDNTRFWLSDHHYRTYANNWEPYANNRELTAPRYCPMYPVMNEEPTPQGEDTIFSNYIGNYRSNLKFSLPARSKNILGANVNVDMVTKEIGATGPAEVKTANYVEMLNATEEAAWSEQVLQAKNYVTECGNPATSSILNTVFNEFKTCVDELVHLRDEIKELASTNGAKADLRALQTKLGRSVGRLASTCQSFDAYCAQLVNALGNPNSGSATWMSLKSAAGLPLGPAEGWLYHFLNYLDAVTFLTAVDISNELPPVWDIFCNDLLGFGRSSMADTDKSNWSSRNAETVLQRLRFVPVQPEDEQHSVTQRANPIPTSDLRSKSLTGEFILIGVREGEADELDSPFTRVRWSLLISTEITEPYSTCRMSYFFAEGPGKSVLDEHINFVEKQWTEDKAFSKGIVDKILLRLNSKSSA